MNHKRITPAARRIKALAIIGKHGTTLDDLWPVVGFEIRQSLSSFMAKMAADGLVFSCRCSADNSKRTAVYYFADAVSRDAFHALHKGFVAIRRKEQDRKRDPATRNKRRQALRAENAARKAAMAPPIAKRERAKGVVAKRDSEGSKRPKIVKEPKTVSIPKYRAGTIVADAPKPGGPARRAGQLDLSRAKVTKAPPPPDRWAVEIPVDGGFSHMRPGQYAFPPVSCAARSA